jgi:hypothetical protein
MSGQFASALARLDAAITAMLPRLPQDAPTARMIRLSSAADAAPRPPERELLEGVRQRLHAASTNGGEPDPKDLKRAPWILWQGDPPAIGFPRLLDRVVDQATRSPRALRYLIEAWLRDFAPRGQGVKSAGLAIERLLVDSSNARMEPWRSAHRRFRLFDTAEGPGALAAAILNASDPVATVLEAACFTDQVRAIGAYMRSVQAELLARLPAALERPTARMQFARACKFLINGTGLRFDDNRAAIAMALCKSFNPARAPEADLQRDVTEFLVAQIGNPQIRPGRWAGAEKESALIRRWLARASLKVFFELISDYALDQQWKYREAFWSACLSKGAIDDAWLALGTTVHASARARQDLGSAFGPLVIAEWSHNGSMRAWLVDEAPRLGRTSYARSDLMRACLPFPSDPIRRASPDTATSGLRHAGSTTGVWQRRAALLLARHANIRLQPIDWRLR